MTASRFRLATALLLAGLCFTAQAQTKVACIGNSITAGYGLPQGTLNYPARLQQLLGNGYTVENDGVSGTTLLKSGDVSYWTKNVGRLANVFTFKPNIVTITLGTNDTKPQNWDVHRGEFKRDYLALIDTLGTLSTKPKIFLGLPAPIWTNTFNIRDSALVSIMAIIKAIGAERNLPVIDCNTPLKPFKAYFSDGVHPNGAGADTLAHVIYRAITEPPVSLQPTQRLTTERPKAGPGPWEVLNIPFKKRIYNLQGRSRPEPVPE